VSGTAHVGVPGGNGEREGGREEADGWAGLGKKKSGQAQEAQCHLHIYSFFQKNQIDFIITGPSLDLNISNKIWLEGIWDKEQLSL
jgi:hypothetical protein